MPSNTGASSQPRSAGTLFKRRVRQSWPSDGDFRILSIDGGGIRGILPLAILASFERRHLRGESIANYFDLITGASTGGIIALGLAKGLTANDILQIYLTEGENIFPDVGSFSRKMQSFFQYFVNRCNTDALYQMIDGMFEGTQIWESRNRLNIPAAETRHFEPFVYKTPHHPDYRLDWSETMAHVAKSTSAAPGHFKPLVSEKGYVFIDGGIWANNPLMIGIADSLACFDLRREQIRVLSLGCGPQKFEMSRLRYLLGGFLTWTTLMFESMHIQSQNVIGQARLIVGGDNVLRIDSAPDANQIELWNWARAKSELPSIGETLAQDAGDQVRAMFFQAKAERYAAHYTPTGGQIAGQIAGRQIAGTQY
jgi:uncharacterized protein